MSWFVSLQHELILPDQPLLLLSTLNGSLIAVDKLTGTELWTLEEGELEGGGGRVVEGSS